MPDGVSAMGTPKMLQALGIALVLCYVAVSRARAEHGNLSKSKRARRAAKDLKRKRPSAEVVCEGLVDLIREEDSPPESEASGPEMTRKELAQGLLVVVVIGPASTKVHQSYVVNKLMRYLRWSNLIRKHFPIADLESVNGYDSAGEYGDYSPSNGRANGNGHKHMNGDANGFATAGNNGAGGEGEGEDDERAQGRAPKTHRYTFSDRGKAAALATIAVQESAKKVASWLNGLSHGGVAVIEAAGAGWASTRRGRAALPGFLRQTADPDLGILWVELLPSGLSHRALSPHPLPTSQGTGAWKSENGLPRVPQGPGDHVVDTFLQSGNLVGAGGHVFYEAVRGGVRGAAGAPNKTCFVSLADQGANVRSQLRDEVCPLLRRVGTFAAALKMKKSWHGCPVYLTRHGESIMNQTKSMGGDGRLSETGDRYAGVLADFVAAQEDAGQSGRLEVWCSPMKRAVQTARAIKCYRYTQWQALRELDTGVFNGYSYKQVESEYHEEFTARERDKLGYRYPEGEGYLDIVNRLDPVIVALEKQDGPVIVISHQAVLRCLYAYFLDIPLRYMPHLPINLHTVVKLTPSRDDQGGTSRWKELRFALIKPTTLEQLAGGVTTMGKPRRASQLGERLS